MPFTRTFKIRYTKDIPLSEWESTPAEIEHNRRIADRSWKQEARVSLIAAETESQLEQNGPLLLNTRNWARLIDAPNGILGMLKSSLPR